MVLLTADIFYWCVLPALVLFIISWNTWPFRTSTLTGDPSTEWKELIPDDEDDENRKTMQCLAQFHMKKNNKELGREAGRTFHLRPTIVIPAKLTVLDGLPDYCQHGIFATPKEYDSVVRLSAGSATKKPDSEGDVRGFALKVKGVEGDSAMGGNGNGSKATEQNFLMIQSNKFALENAAQLASVSESSQKARGNPIALFKDLAAKEGLLTAIGMMKSLLSEVGKPFSGFATTTFNTCAPHKCGPYACRLGLKLSTDRVPNEVADEEYFLTKDFEKHLEESGELEYDLQLQFFTDESQTPIEDPTVAWNSAFVTVAKLTISKESLSVAHDDNFVKEVEMMSFNLWKGLEDHRPLGHVNRARKFAYPQSAERRGAV